MEKTTNSARQTSKRNSFIVLSGIIFLFALLIPDVMYAISALSSGGYSASPLSFVMVAADAVLIVTLLSPANSKRMLIALALQVFLPTTFLFASLIVRFPFFMESARVCSAVLFFINYFLLSGDIRQGKNWAKKLWGLPIAVAILWPLILMILLESSREYNDLPMVNLTLQAYAISFLSIGLGKPQVGLGTITSMVSRAIKRDWDSMSDGEVFATIFLGGAVLGMLLAIATILAIGTDDPFNTYLLILMPCLGGIVTIIVAGIKGADFKGAKRFKHDLNEIMARSGSEKAKAELRKEAAKKARNEVIKGAIVGGIIAGDAGAVVGAMATKAGQDASKTGADPASGKAAAKEVVKGAVIGGIVAGDAGAIVGATAAKAGQDAKDKSDK